MYVPLKKENPNFPILIRECSGIQPKLWARYGNIFCIKYYYILIIKKYILEMGKENSVTLTNLSAGEVMNQIQKLSQN